MKRYIIKTIIIKIHLANFCYFFNDNNKSWKSLNINFEHLKKINLKKKTKMCNHKKRISCF